MRGQGSASGAALAGRTHAAERVGDVLMRLRLGQTTSGDEARAAAARADAHGVPARTAGPGDAVDPVWIDRLGGAPLEAAAAAGEATPLGALSGIPVAVKGNIDVAGLPTTAGCPSFASSGAADDATAVARLRAAGATVLGTTNLDQFATGLSGARSPFGIPRAVADPSRISGGSSSGSAVAVARGDVPVALGTDTAGSGRVPAALNGIVGLKPSRGLVSCAGVVPACRSLDVVSIFTADVASAALVLEVVAGPDHADPWSRSSTGYPLPPPRPLDLGAIRLGVPRALPDTVVDPAAAAAWEATLAAVKGIPGLELVELDLEPLLAAGRQLYGGAFVAERHAAVGAFIDARLAVDPQDPTLDPTVRDIILAGAAVPAGSAFAAIDGMRARTLAAHRQLADVDALLTPTVLEHPTVDEMLAAPVQVNARLGHFTTFGNLLDLAVLALPGVGREDGLPFGISLHAPAFSEQRLLALGARIERELPGDASEDDDGRVLVAVCGAHMAGLPANPELLRIGAAPKALGRSAATYALHRLPTPAGERPGLERVGQGRGRSIELELWSIDGARLAELAAVVPPGLALGPVELLGGQQVLGFLAAAGADVADAPAVEGWRHHLRAQA